MTGWREEERSFDGLSSGRGRFEKEAGRRRKKLKLRQRGQASIRHPMEQMLAMPSMLDKVKP
jgi:hypothetical protein